MAYPHQHPPLTLLPTTLPLKTITSLLLLKLTKHPYPHPKAFAPAVPSTWNPFSCTGKSGSLT